MKIAILTYHNAINYGAILQAMALNRVINDMGYECNTIDYQSCTIKRQYNFRRLKDSTSLKNFFAHNLICILHEKKKKRFYQFLENIRLSQKCTKEELKQVVQEYSIVIVGSDQVFNPVSNNNDTAYFLDFSDTQKKCSYGASIGSIEQFERMKFDPFPYLKNFEIITMREEESAAYFQKKLNRKCDVVLDPVWLLPVSEWEKYISFKKKEDYIFVYNLMDYSYMREKIKKLKKETGLPVYVVNRTIIGEYQYFGWSKNFSNCSPGDFLGLIKNATYIVTDSFHGTSFAIIFRKQFFSALNPETSNTNSRITNILKKCNLEERSFTPEKEIDGKNIIDYSVLGNMIEEEKSQSIELLRNICSLN